VRTFELHRDAERDLDAETAFYEERSAGLGMELVDEVERAIGSIREHPFASPLCPGIPAELGIRRRLLERFPFALPFMLQGDHIIVLAVAHHSRSPGFWLSRARSSSR
jgi:toxin ParE1/3/4